MFIYLCVVTQVVHYTKVNVFGSENMYIFFQYSC